MVRNVRTDMALEAREMHGDIGDVTERTEKRGTASVTTIEIQTEEAAKRLGKPVGRYVTIEESGIAKRNPAAFQSASDAAANALSGLLGSVQKGAPLLIVGLGNRHVTADSLGPRVVSKLFVTRHILKTMPELVPDGLPSVAAVAPGVLGVTGVETLEVVRGLIREIRPAALLCVDALASLRASRIHTAIQINDTGILPGAGVGNRRQGLDRGTLSLPVFAIGVPTVVYAHTIVIETVSKMSGTSGEALDALTESVMKTMDDLYGDMIVTTKDVDRMVEDAANILAEAINRALYRERYAEIKELLS